MSASVASPAPSALRQREIAVLDGAAKPARAALRRQREVFALAEGEGLELAEALARCDMTLDDLVYERSGEEAWHGGPPPGLDDFRGPGHGIPMVSFFTGCGGIDLGFEAAGFRHLAAFEHAELFCRTLRQNRPGWKVFGPPEHPGDLSQTQQAIAALEAIIPVNFEGVFTGGPPCQPFSVAANQRFSKGGANFKRVGFGHEVNGSLLFRYVALIEHFRPACFLIENVPGLRDLDGGTQLSRAVAALEKAGYKVAPPAVFNAADYGVPQFRERLFVVGSRTGGPVAFPAPCGQRYGAGSVLGRCQGEAPNTEIRSHRLESVRRYMRLRYGQRDQLGRVDRLSPRRPSKTVIAGGVRGGGRSHLHPEIPRTLSVRECARLQTFPDSYAFAGPTARQFTQVGNAVPPVLAAQIGLALAGSVFGAA